MNDEDVLSSFELRARKAAQSDARFYVRLSYDEALSRRKGRPVFVPRIFLRVNTGEGDIKDVLANDMHKEKYADQWDFYSRFVNPAVEARVGDDYSAAQMKVEFPDQFAEYVARLKKEGIGGTLVEESGIVPLSVAQMLKYWGIFSVEQLANMPASQNVVEESVINTARDYLHAAEDREYVARAVDEAARLREEMKSKDAQIAALLKKLTDGDK